MDFNLSNLDCPQFINFETEILKRNNFLDSLESSPLGLSVKDDSTATLDVEEDCSMSYPIQDQSMPNYLHSPYSEAYLASSGSYKQSPGGYSLRSGSSIENYPVIHPKNLSLPDNAIKKNSKAGKTTRTKAFHLKESQKRKREDEHIPMAEQVAAFHRKTPKRFHTTGPKVFQPTKHWSPAATHPISPNLQAAKRLRGVHVPSYEEKEAQLVEEMKRYRFRARPINHGIQRKRESLKLAKKPSTKPKDLQLRTAQRAAEQLSHGSKEDEKRYEFRARPVPTAILNGPTGLKEKPPPPVTEAKTPNFALKKRAEKWKSNNNLNETVTVQPFRAQPLPVQTDPFVVKHEKKCIEVEPFSFDSKDKERIMLKEKKIMEVIEKENAVYQFKAQPMPGPAPSALPAVPKKPPTQPAPFNFLLEEKHSKHSSLNSSVDQLCPTFKAQPATVLKRPPFIPEKSDKPVAEVKEFHLHTDIRASERLKLKEINNIKEQEKELALQRLKELQEEEERKEIAKLRKEIVHKANPIKLYKPLEIKPSSKPPTQPITPKFKTDERLQAKN